MHEPAPTLTPLPRELRGVRVLVVGLGRSGLAAARQLLSRGAIVTANDRRPLVELGREAAALELAGVKIVAGGHDAELFRSAEAIVVSPGVPLELPPLAQAIERGVPVAGEVDLVAAQLGARSIAITGSNGKSTTTALVAAMLAADDRDAVACGNFGLPLAEAALSDRSDRWYSIELSSFQLETNFLLRAAATILLNIQPDHLDRHGSVERYAAAKYRIATLRAAGAGLVLCSDDPLVRPLLGKAEPPVFEVSLEREPRRGGFERGMSLLIRTGAQEELLAERHELPIPGRHNRLNILAAAVACRSAGVGFEAIRRGLLSFRALPHRLQDVAQVGGVRYVDDSKATNVGSALEAIRALAGPKLWLLLGGRDKNSDFRPLAAEIREQGVTALTFGEAGPKIAAVLAGEGVTALERCDTLEAALRRARALAAPGEIVLLSPACASFDAYTGYAARGDHFALLARSFAEEQ